MSRRATEIEDRYYTRSPHVDRSPFGFRADDPYERRRPRSPSPERRRVTTTEVVERRSPAFIEEDLIRREREREGGVLVRREVETTRRRSPSPAPRGILRSRVRSVSPTRAQEEIERIRREEIIQTQTRSPRLRSRSRSPSMEARLRNRFDERRRSLEEHERTETRIVERERRMARSPSSSRSSSPSPSPPVIRGPTIEREVVTHYRDIDHGVVQARPQPRFNHVSPPFRHRSVSRERRAPRSEIDLLNSAYDELRITDTTIDDRHSHSVSSTHRRSHSAAPPMSPADREEAEYITNRIESRGRPGEAKHGVTKQWEIVDVPPGTERVRMDGAGGAGVDIDWTQYSGVRRTRFVPDRDRDVQSDRGDDEVYTRRSVTDFAPQVEREREVHIEKVTDRKILRPSPPMPPPPRKPDMWTEITKDLVLRQAIEALNLDYEETEFHFYVMQYLKYEDVLELIELSDDIRRRRRDRAAGWDRVGDWERQHRVRPLRSVGGYDEVDRIVEKKTTYDRTPLRSYR